MSAPAFGWALEQGAVLGLSPAERLVLIYLADMANGEKVCWPGQPRIAKFTGLAIRTVISVLRKLEDRQLIRASSSAGRVTRYHILRETPANGTGDAPAIRPVVTPANGAAVADAPLQTVHGGPCKPDGEPLHITTETPANGADDPSSTQERDPRARVPAREEAKISSSEKGQEGEAAPPAPDNPSVSFDEWLDSGAPADRAIAAATPDPDVLTGEVLPPETAVGANATMAVIRGLGRTMRHFALTGVAADRTVNEQREAILSPLRAQDPIRTPAEQYAAIMGCPLAEAEARLPISPRATADA